MRLLLLRKSQRKKSRSLSINKTKNNKEIKKIKAKMMKKSNMKTNFLLESNRY